jgi:formylglycine-generating enzyme required for sulfatase activity
MLYVPAGPFLFGSSGDDGLRRFFFNTAPLHERVTDAFWVGRHEVTLGEWIAFLEDLPPQERERRTPGAQGAMRPNGLALTRLAPGRWRLTLALGQRTVEASSGERLRLPARARRAEQDWLRFPASAISFDDARAYVAWLSATGRVPGARLCSDLEWERAARGADGRTYPASEELKPDDLNHDLTYGRVADAFGPDEVGSHPRSRSPFGLEDAAGNVWELTHAAADSSKPVMRGGSWYHEALNSQLANREPSELLQRDALLGLRVCATPKPRLRSSP